MPFSTGIANPQCPHFDMRFRLTCRRATVGTTVPNLLIVIAVRHVLEGMSNSKQGGFAIRFYCTLLQLLKMPFSTGIANPQRPHFDMRFRLTCRRTTVGGWCSVVCACKPLSFLAFTVFVGSVCVSGVLIFFEGQEKIF